jgi:hypothetical protein
MAVSLLAGFVLLAGSAVSAQQASPTTGGAHWPPFTPAAPDRSEPAPPPVPPAVGLPSVVLLPEHPTPVPPAPVSSSGMPAGSWQPNLPMPAGSAVALAPMSPSPAPQMRPAQPYIRQMRLQDMGLRGGDENVDYQIQLEVPGPDRLFRRESEQSLQMRIQQEARGRSNLDRIAFPDEPVLSTDTYTARVFPPATQVVEPFYVFYGRLDFEDVNSERYGWDLGLIQPVVSAGIFFKDAALIPYKLGSFPFRWWDCNTGYCLPGDPVPYLVYPPEITLSGGLLEAGTAIALVAIFPG